MLGVQTQLDDVTITTFAAVRKGKARKSSYDPVFGVAAWVPADR